MVKYNNVPHVEGDLISWSGGIYVAKKQQAH